MLQYPLVDITNQEFNGDFKYLLYFLCALSLPTFVLIVLFMRHRKKYYGEIVVKSPNTSIQGSPSVAGARLDRSNSYGVDVLTKSPGRTGGFALWSGIDNVNEQTKKSFLFRSSCLPLNKAQRCIGSGTIRSQSTTPGG